MNVLILSVKAGYGHHSTAKAIIEKFTERGHNCQMFDIFEKISPALGNTIQDGYLLSTKYLDSLYGKVYNSMAEKNTPYKSYSATAVLSKLVTKKLTSYVEEFKPDLIIGTHSYAGVVITILKNEHIIDCPTIGIVTDFTVHPFWESTVLDYYVIPDKRLSYEMVKKGITADKILPVGIPIRKQFETKTAKEEARKILGIADKKTVLLMMGSMGYGNIKKTLLDIDSAADDFQVLCVCGSNARMYRAVNKREWNKNIIAYGFADNVDVMMDASDVVITKPGGLTTSETLAKGLPMIAANPIPGQEHKNLLFLLNNGAALAAGEYYPISDALNQLFGYDDKRIEEMKISAKRLGKPNATEELYEFCERNFFAKPVSAVNSIPER
ncbi:MAG: glycosyltransferase [Firmicutes bacterium]|nr:glycosyltransferase [Bacillota bacterium]